METPLLAQQPRGGELVGQCGHFGVNGTGDHAHVTGFDAPIELRHPSGSALTILWAVECDDCFNAREGEWPVVRTALWWPTDDPIVRESIQH